MKKVLYILMFTSLVSCEQTVDPYDIYVPTPTDLLVGNWRGVTASSSPCCINACVNDDIYLFTRDGIANTADVGSTCSPGGSNSVGTWKWTNDGDYSQITVSGWGWGIPYLPNIWNITVLNETELSAYINVLYNGSPLTINYNLVKE